MRTILAIATGFVVVAVLSLGTDLVAMQVFPGAYNRDGRVTDARFCLLTMAYSAFFTALGSYVTASIGRAQETRHALLLGCTLLAVALPATISRWNNAPAWFHIFSLALVVPAAWAGGLLRQRQQARR